MVNTYTISAEITAKIEEFNTHGLLLPDDRSCDRITRLAAKLLDVPGVILYFQDAERTWVKSVYGLTRDRIDLEDVSLKKAGLLASDGICLGKLCVFTEDDDPLDCKQMSLLQEIADMYMSFLEAQLGSKQAYAEQKQLLQIAAHDLKNPLTTIPVRADLIKLKKHEPEIVDAMCDQIKKAGLMMTRTIDELLNTITMDEGKISLFNLNLDFGELVAQLVESNEALAVNKKQRIELDIQANPIVNGDEQRLMEIVDNLINNAIKYAPIAGVIKVSVQKQGREAILKVQDNGPGLTEEDKSRMFRPYSKLSAHPTGNEKSTGLGLSIVKQLVDAHCGKVWAESDGKGMGTCFYVSIPTID